MFSKLKQKKEKLCGIALKISAGVAVVAVFMALLSPFYVSRYAVLNFEYSYPPEVISCRFCFVQ